MTSTSLLPLGAAAGGGSAAEGAAPAKPRRRRSRRAIASGSVSPERNGIGVKGRGEGRRRCSIKGRGGEGLLAETDRKIETIKNDQEYAPLEY